MQIQARLKNFMKAPGSVPENINAFLDYAGIYSIPIALVFVLAVLGFFLLSINLIFAGFALSSSAALLAYTTVLITKGRRAEEKPA